MASIVITKETVRRVAKDVREILNNPLSEHGIYYEHDQNDILKGCALIIGPPDTPYEGGYFFFKFQFPTNYPHQPPVVTYCTNDGKTRFNPNLYRSGKVCLSVLNTWKGPQWTGCQTISSILLSLCATVLNDKPLLNEPGIDETHKDFINYNEIIKYKTFEIAILKAINDTYYREHFGTLCDVMVAHYHENKERILNRILDENPHSRHVKTSLYNMNVTISYTKLVEKLI
jgi:ubiquitin-conjugating enzyme E2 Z